MSKNGKLTINGVEVKGNSFMDINYPGMGGIVAWDPEDEGISASDGKIQLNELDVMKISVNPNELLIVKLDMSRYNETDVNALMRAFKQAFDPAVHDRILIVPHDIDFSSIKMEKKKEEHPIYGD